MELKKLMIIYIISLLILISECVNSSFFYIFILNIKDSILKLNFSFAIKFILAGLGVILITFLTINEYVKRTSTIKLIKRES